MRQSPAEERAERVAFAKRAALARIALMDSPDDQENAARLVQCFEEIALSGASARIIAAISRSYRDPSKRSLRATITYPPHDGNPVYNGTIPYGDDQEIPIVPFFEELRPDVDPNSVVSDARYGLLAPDSDGTVLYIDNGTLTACSSYDPYYDPNSPIWTATTQV